MSENGRRVVPPHRVPIFFDIDAERDRQDMLHGPSNATNSAVDWIVILTEEVGEAAAAALDVRYCGMDARRLQVGRAEMREELVHVAAVAVAAIEAIDRGSV